MRKPRFDVGDSVLIDGDAGVVTEVFPDDGGSYMYTYDVMFLDGYVDCYSEDVLEADE